MTQGFSGPPCLLGGLSSEIALHCLASPLLKCVCVCLALSSLDKDIGRRSKPHNFLVSTATSQNYLLLLDTQLLPPGKSQSALSPGSCAVERLLPQNCSGNLGREVRRGGARLG